MEEVHNYPFDPVIKFKQPGRSFSYKIIKEGTYPNKSSLVYTLPPNKYRIPDNYVVETTWGRSTNQCTVQCIINYNDSKPVFQICFGKYFEYKVSSVKTATDAANLFHKQYSSQKGTKTSGIYLFGLQLKILDKKAPNFYNVEEIPVLENIRYSVNNHIFDINYGNEDKTKKKRKIESIVRVLDEENISRNPYRRLCAIESHLPREGAVSKERQRINEEMAQLIPISIVDVNTKNQVDQSEEEDIEDEAIVQEVIDAVGKGGYRNIKDILQYLVPDLIQKGILNPHQPTINLRISGDGRNVGRKVKHVMVAVAILDDKRNLDVDEAINDQDLKKERTMETWTNEVVKTNLDVDEANNDKNLKKRMNFGNLDVDEVINDQDLKKERTMETWTRDEAKRPGFKRTNYVQGPDPNQIRIRFKLDSNGSEPDSDQIEPDLIRFGSDQIY
ncbi:hypothetical protein RhiirC2_781923 [Rhizophagus irregularis]|uniref:Uncharacterized protein n=1 Tax=Rhizophagus irregularis TaxID=588596 RepID=A0A2N1N488_9GLOM|nr:hypothetical protein RhiirC2_781923 [Rhizophagus irregularis]